MFPSASPNACNLKDWPEPSAVKINPLFSLLEGQTLVLSQIPQLCPCLDRLFSQLSVSPWEIALPRILGGSQDANHKHQAGKVRELKWPGGIESKGLGVIGLLGAHIHLKVFTTS